MLSKARTIVFKVGTSTLTHETGKTNLKGMEELVLVLSELMNEGRQVVLVTSGAIGVGVGKLGLPARPKDTPGKQAAATVGQCELMFIYDKMFAQYGHKVGQLLITKEDVDDPKRKQNLVQTFERLFTYGAIPIVNENDAVAVDEIVYGDNDSLSAVVASLIHADALVILTDTDEIRAYATGAGTALGTGGMVTKLHAAQIATAAGVDTYIISGKAPRDIYRLMDGADLGTHFPAKERA